MPVSDLENVGDVAEGGRERGKRRRRNSFSPNSPRQTVNSSSVLSKLIATFPMDYLCMWHVVKLCDIINAMLALLLSS